MNDSKKKFLLRWIAPSLFLFPGCLMGQEQSDLVNYFTRSLNGVNVDAPHKRLSIKKLNDARQFVWNAWKEANKSFNEDKLGGLVSLDSPVSRTWALPDSLEPAAVMPYYYGQKGDLPKDGYPLFVYLHGSGPKSNEWANGLYFGQHFSDAPSAYFIPQIPNEGEWYRWWQKGKQFAWEKLLRQAMLSDSINPARIYIFGISEGGYGSQRLAAFYADYWAAAGPMAGGEPLKNAPAENLSNLPFHMQTGAEDKGFYRNILTGYVADALDSLENLQPTKYRHSVTLIPGKGHHIDYTKTTPWLSHFTRISCPLQFTWEDFEMDGRHRSGFYNLLVGLRPDKQLRTRYDVSVNKDSNIVDIVVENVIYTTTQRDSIFGIEMKFHRDYEIARGGSFTLFLNEDMVNLRVPVVVRVNGHRAFYGTPKLSMSNMARSVAAFFDPNRIFPAAIDVKY